MVDLFDFYALVSAFDAAVSYSVDPRLVIEESSGFVMEVVLILRCYDFVSSSVAALF